MSDETDRIANMSVVVVDDNRNFLKLVRSILRNFGVKDCTVFDDPAAALAYLEIHAVDCVITDLVMPRMNGFELAFKIRHSTVMANRLLPIIMVTGHANRENVTKAINAGIDEVLVKPFRPTDMRKRLVAIAANPRRYIRTPETRAGSEQSRQPDRGKPVDSRAAAGRTGNYFDKKVDREPEGAKSAAPKPAPEKTAVRQSDVFTVNRRAGKEPPQNDDIETVITEI